MSRKHFLLFPFLLISLATLASPGALPVEIVPPDELRVEEIAAYLRQSAPALPSIKDRRFWKAAAEAPYLAEHIGRAEQALLVEVPSMEAWRDAYLEYSRSGDRSRWGSLVFHPKDAIRLFTLAEAIENKGRFLPVLEQRIREICAWPTWVINAHDPQLDNYEGRIIQVDLGSAMLGSDLASCMMVLGDRLDPAVRKLLSHHLHKRVLEPFRKEVMGEQTPMFWLTTTNNWNAVCLSGVVVTALGGAESPEACAWYLAAAEHLITNFLAGFSSDGYCSEGLGYWGYGYGYFIVMTEYLRRATDGRLDLMALAPAQTAGLFPFAIEIVEGVYPAFADCPIDQTPTQTWTWYVARRMGLDPSLGQLTKHPSAEAFSLAGRLLFVGDEPLPRVDTIPIQFDPLRHPFTEAGVLVSRALGEHPFGMAVKAGHNAEHHNHNDVGSYVIVNNGEPILCDPGKEKYTRDTFSEKRYLRPVHNSYGHPVPVVDGRLQATGGEAAGTIIGKRLEEDHDTVIIDLKAAYEGEGLEMLVRTLHFNRVERTITITDTVKFDKPRPFSTAMVSFGRFSREGNTLQVMDGPASARVKVSIDGAEPVYQTEELKVDWDAPSRGGTLPQRMEIACDQPVVFATIKCVVELPEGVR